MSAKYGGRADDEEAGQEVQAGECFVLLTLCVSESVGYCLGIAASLGQRTVKVLMLLAVVWE